MNNEIATVEASGSALVLESQQTFWNDHQLAALRQIGVGSASNGDLAVFMHVCQRTGLDPFARQIHMIEREGKQTIQTGIDGYRLIARRSVDRSGETLAFGAVEWCGADKVWTDVWIDSEPPVAARVTVYRNGDAYPGIALYAEYVQRKRDGAVTRMWTQRAAGQLAKCAEALALRKAFPQDLSGIYVDEELQHVGNPVRGEVVQRGLGAALAAQASDPDAGPPPDEPEPSPSPGAGGSGSEPVDAEEMITDAQIRNLGRLFGKTGLNIADRDEQFVKISTILGREVTSKKDLTLDDASKVIDALDADLLARGREQ